MEALTQPTRLFPPSFLSVGLIPVMSCNRMTPKA